MIKSLYEIKIVETTEEEFDTAVRTIATKYYWLKDRSELNGIISDLKKKYKNKDVRHGSIYVSYEFKTSKIQEKDRPEQLKLDV